MLISKLRTKSTQKHKLKELDVRHEKNKEKIIKLVETDYESPSKSSSICEQYIETDLSKPLLNSKKNLSNMLITNYSEDYNTENYKTEPRKKSDLNTSEMRIMNEESKFLIKDSPIRKPNFDPPIGNKSIRVSKQAKYDVDRIRETDPVLCKQNKNFMKEKKSLKEFQKVREGSSYISK